MIRLSKLLMQTRSNEIYVSSPINTNERKLYVPAPSYSGIKYSEITKHYREEVQLEVYFNFQ